MTHTSLLHGIIIFFFLFAIVVRIAFEDRYWIPSTLYFFLWHTIHSIFFFLVFFLLQKNFHHETNHYHTLFLFTSAFTRTKHKILH